MTTPFCARCGHPLTTHALNRRAFSECSECGPCAFVPLKIGGRPAQWRPALFFCALIVLLIVVGRFIQ